jgi:murein DD-endopeptidase MepM/ murein hydrolase activator NlpD
MNLFTCYDELSNAPSKTADRQILDFAAIIVVNGVALASAPTNDVCLSSGFGPRFGRIHKGIDLAAPEGTPVFSAAPGTIREVSLARGYGNQIVIDHGRGVFTRYAHLSAFTPDLRPGQKVGFGVEIGLVGRSGNATGAHLHYEVLTGTYAPPRGSFGLNAHNPLTFPRLPGLAAAS